METKLEIEEDGFTQLITEEGAEQLNLGVSFANTVIDQGMVDTLQDFLNDRKRERRI